MKKITLSILSFIGIILISEAQTQSLQVFFKNSAVNISGQSIVVDATLDGDIYQTIGCDTITVKNISANSIVTRCTRNVISAVAGSENSFCWGSGCYGVSTNTSPLLQSPTIAPSTAENTFVGDYKPHLNAGSTTIKYLFYDNANGTDSVSVTVVYSIATGINEPSKVSGTISAAYPNPSNSFVSIKYDMNEFSQKGKIVLYDMLGKAVKIMELTDKQGVSKINVSDLNSGIYFYTFSIDDKAIATKKLVVSSR